MEEEEEENENVETQVLLLIFKYGLNVGRIFKFVNDNTLVISHSPAGAQVFNGDRLVKWRGLDVRNWTPADYTAKLQKNLDRACRIEAWIYRKGYNKADLDPNVKVRHDFQNAEFTTIGCVTFSFFSNIFREWHGTLNFREN